MYKGVYREAYNRHWSYCLDAEALRLHEAVQRAA